MPNSDQTVARPLSGTTTVSYIGTLAFASGYTNTNVYIEYPFTATGATNTAFNFTADVLAANNGGVYNGVIFTITVDPTTALGFYNRAADLPVRRPSITFTAMNGAGNIVTNRAFYTLNVTPSAEVAAPEPGSLSLIGVLGGVLFAAAMRRKRY
jgi:hypothetical protein